MSIKDRAANWSSPSTPASRGTSRRTDTHAGERQPHQGPLVQIARGALDGTLAFVLVFLALLAYGSIGNRWYRICVVTSGSMSPVFEAGDLIIVSPAPAEPQVGMIACMRAGKETVTHRIVSIDDQGLMYTQGDANDVADAWTLNPADPDAPVSIVGVYRGRISGLGFLIDGLSHWLGALGPSGTVAEFRDAATLSIPFSAGTW